MDCWSRSAIGGKHVETTPAVQQMPDTIIAWAPSTCCPQDNERRDRLSRGCRQIWLRPPFRRFRLPGKCRCGELLAADGVFYTVGIGTVQRSAGSSRFGNGQICACDPVKSVPKPGTDRAVVDCATDLEQQIGAPSRPSHLLGFVRTPVKEPPNKSPFSRSGH